MENSKHFVAIGASCIDEYYESNKIPSLGDKVNCKYKFSIVGGMIGNAAAVYAGFGNKTYMIDFTNNKPINDLLIEDLIKYNVDPTYVVRDDKYSDAKCLIILTQGERIIYVVENNDHGKELTLDQVQLINKAEYIYTTIADMRRINNSKQLIKTAKLNGTKLVYDIEANSINILDEDIEYIKLADIIFVNQSGYDYFVSNLGSNFIEEFLKTMQLVIVTLGEKGSVIYSKDKVIRNSAFKVEIVDSTGAGDTFNAAFLYGLSKQWALEDIGRFASAAAAKAITKLGPRSGVTSEKEVREFIDLNIWYFNWTY